MADDFELTNAELNDMFMLCWQNEINLPYMIPYPAEVIEKMRQYIRKPLPANAQAASIQQHMQNRIAGKLSEYNKLRMAKIQENFEDIEDDVLSPAEQTLYEQMKQNVYKLLDQQIFSQVESQVRDVLEKEVRNQISVSKQKDKQVIVRFMENVMEDNQFYRKDEQRIMNALKIKQWVRDLKVVVIK